MTAVNKHQEHLNGRRIAQIRGRTLGGSAAINMNMLVYPSKGCIDGWSRLGNPGWDWDSLLPYYRKFHTFIPPSKDVHDLLALEYMNEKSQGTSGPIQVSFGGGHGPVEKAWPEAFKNLGLTMSGDPLSGTGRGGLSNPATIDPKTKTRSHAGSTYYSTEVAKRSNLQVITDALAEKIVLVETDGTITATGVQFLAESGKSYTVDAQKEVIIAAGTFQSPHILELSGIGSANLLKSHEIDAFIDNPSVGENLQDHLVAVLGLEAADGVPSADALRDPMVFKQMMELYQTAGEGPLAASTYSSAFTPVLNLRGNKGQDEMTQLLNQHTCEIGAPGFPSQNQQYDLLKSILQSPDDDSVHYGLAAFQMNALAGDSPKQYLAPSTPGNYLSFMIALSHPFSRGSVHLNSRDPAAHPTIDPRYLSHPLDAEVLARHVQYVETLAQTEPLASLFKKEGRRCPPDTTVNDLQSAKEIIKQGISYFHPTGTCAMMPKAIGGVVNERLIVHGTRNLRIVDASIMPLQPRGNIMSSVYAIAEKAGDMIKEDRN